MVSMMPAFNTAMPAIGLADRRGSVSVRMPAVGERTGSTSLSPA